MMMDIKLLNLVLVFFPLGVAASFYLFPRGEKKSKNFALLSSLTYFALILFVFLKNPGEGVSLYKHKISFLPFSVDFFLDGLNFPLILLTGFLSVITVLATWNTPRDYKLYYANLFLLLWSASSCMLAKNLISFFIFWEFMLIPLFLLIGVFGAQERIKASFKFFLYTATGSLLFFAAILYLGSLSYKLTGSFDIDAQVLSQIMTQIPFGGFFTHYNFIFLAFCLAFFIKIPVFPFHSWLPHAHVQAPTAGSIILAGVLLKVGVYAIMRWVLPHFPEGVAYYQDFFILLGILGVIYGSLAAIYQPNFKKMVAFSSVAHMGIIVAGLFSQTKLGLEGAYLQSIAHGLTSAGLFIAVNILYERFHTKEISDFGGMAKTLPLFTVLYFIILLGSVAAPFTIGFAGEFSILWSLFSVNTWFPVFAALGVILGPIYMLNSFQKIFQGEAKYSEAKKLTWQETVAIICLVLPIIFYGLFPSCLIKLFRVALEPLVKGIM